MLYYSFYVPASPLKKTRRYSRVFVVKREILCNQNMIARGCAAELSVARSTMRVNSPVPAERRMLSFSALGFEFVFLPSLSELLGGA